MKDQQEWNIKSRSDACTQCEKSFEDKETICSNLSFGEEGYQRGDFCEACWEEAQKKPAISVWRGEFRMPPPPPEEALKKETAESLLRQLIQQEDPSHANTIYILAVMLERRRIFAEKEVQLQDDGSKIRVYEHKKSGEVFIVTDPELKLAEIEEVQDEVVVMLGGKPRAEQEKPEKVEEADEDEEDDD